MIIVAVSKMGIAGLFFVEPGLKVKGKYYRNVLQSQQCYLLSDIITFNTPIWQPHQSRKPNKNTQVDLCIYVAYDNFVFQRMGRVTQSNSCSVKHLISFLQSYAPQQSGSESCWLYDLGSHAAPCVRDADSQCVYI